MMQHKKLTPEECLAIGGHCWEEYIVNETSAMTLEFKPWVKLGEVPTNKIKYRICKHCDTKQQFYPGEWK